MFVFANVLLDRVLLSAKGSDGFHLDVIGLDHLTSAFAAGHGCILLGSHLGSFDVLRAFGRGSPVPVRALMHRDDRGQYSRLLEQLDPTLQDHVIQTGSGDSMLRVREALAGGEIVGVFADRAPSGGRAGRKSLAVPFLGQPAMFPTGPFLLIRHLDAPAVLFFGIRTGRRRYALLFEPFTPDGSLRQTITAYATGWPISATPTRSIGSTSIRFGSPVRMRPCLRATIALLLLSLPAAAQPTSAQLAPELMAALARIPERHAIFHEQKTLSALSKPLLSSGTLTYRRPDHLEKITLAPTRETLVVDAGRLTVQQDDRPPRVLDLGTYPEIRALVEAILGTLRGDLPALTRTYTVQLIGSMQRWELMLDAG